MAENQMDFLQTNLFVAAFTEYVFKDVMIQKIDRLEQQVADIESRLEKSGQNKKSHNLYLTFEARQKREQAPKKTEEISNSPWQSCKKIVERALEILTEWEEADDIKIQIQYAAVMVGKIEKLKKTDVIQADDIRNKISTLLRNVIRLNASEEIFSREQIALLKEGFSLIIANNIQKEDLLQLNRKLRKKGLATMPAWE